MLNACIAYSFVFNEARYFTFSLRRGSMSFLEAVSLRHLQYLPHYLNTLLQLFTPVLIFTLFVLFCCADWWLFSLNWCYCRGNDTQILITAAYQHWYLTTPIDLYILLVYRVTWLAYLHTYIHIPHTIFWFD